MFDERAWALGPQSLVLLLFALVLDAYVGDAPLVFRFLPHPLSLMRRIARGLDRRLNRKERDQHTRRMRGVLVVAVLTLGAAAIGGVLEWLGNVVPFAWIVEFVVIAALLAQRESYLGARLVARALDAGDMETARAALDGLERGPRAGDAFGLARAAIEAVALRLADRVAAPVFWFVLLGLPGMLAYRMVEVLDATLRARRAGAFGGGAARLDEALQLVPARLAGILVALAALFVPTGRPGAALKVMARDARRHRSLNAGWPQAAMAGALGLALALGGPAGRPRSESRDTQPPRGPWLGDGRARAEPEDVRRALFLFAVACLIDAALVGLLALSRGA